MICRCAKSDQFAVHRRLIQTCRRLPPTYRYVAAVSMACVICSAHLLVQQAFLPAQTADIVTVTHQPWSADHDVTTDTSARRSEHAFDWTSGRDTGCDRDVMTRNNFDDAEHVVWDYHLLATWVEWPNSNINLLDFKARNARFDSWQCRGQRKLIDEISDDHDRINGRPTAWCIFNISSDILFVSG